MKTLIALLLLATAAQARSPYAGKLDLTGDPEAIAFRELNDGMWLIGAQKNLWVLRNVDKNVEVIHLAAFYATRLEGQNPAYGPALGFNFGESIRAAVSKLELLAPLIPTNFPPWVSKLADWVSLDFYGGYRPSVAADQHHIVYGFGGKVRIPVGSLASWAKGSPWNGTGPNTLGL